MRVAVLAVMLVGGAANAEERSAAHCKAHVQQTCWESRRVSRLLRGFIALRDLVTARRDAEQAPLMAKRKAKGAKLELLDAEIAKINERYSDAIRSAELAYRVGVRAYEKTCQEIAANERRASEWCELSEIESLTQISDIVDVVVAK